jgi:hypothetical protein
MPLSASILARLQFQHQTIQELIIGLPEETLRQRVHPDKWSAFENIVHLAAYQPVFIRRLERMQTEASPEFERYVAEQDPLFLSYLERPLSSLLTDIDEKRAFIFSELSGMSDEMLGKKGLHPLYGLFSVGQWADFFLLHEGHHLFIIFKLAGDQRKGLSAGGTR